MPAPVSLSQGPPNVAYTNVNDYDASNNLTYSGVTRSVRAVAATLTVSSVSKANPAVVTVTAHGLLADSTVRVAGGTGDWAGINGVQKITVINANSFSIPVDTSAYADSFAGTITTCSPQTGAAIWAIQRNYYDASNNLTRSAWADGNSAMDNSWADRASLNYL